MIDIAEIEKEIKKLENSDCTTYGVCDKLAKLYIVRDHLKDINKMESPMMATSMSSVMPK
jgi:hypothetical protein